MVGIAVSFGEENNVSGRERLVEVNFAELRVAQAVYVVELVANFCEVFKFGAGVVVGWRGGTGSTVAVAVEGCMSLLHARWEGAHGRAVEDEGSERILCW